MVLDVSMLQELRFRATSAERDCLRKKLNILERTLNQPWWKRLLRQIGVKANRSEVSIALESAANARDKPLIGLVVDTPDWAFANIAQQIQANLRSQFDFDIIPLSIINNNPVLALYLTKECDLVHFLWREAPLDALNDRSLTDSVDLYFGSLSAMEAIIVGRTTLSVYDHLYLGKEDIAWRSYLFNECCIGYTVCSERLREIYSDIKEYRDPRMVIQDGVDLLRFSPINLERFDNASGRALTVGWVGNSAWAGELFEDAKGLHTIVLPALSLAAGDGLSIRSHFADRQKGFVPHDKMAAYYAEIDVLVCASLIEGTPNPVLEAMACGVPVISTDVGVVPEVFGPLQSQFILPERKPEALLNMLKKIVAAPNLLRKLSDENLVQIQDWQWSRQAQKFHNFFADALLYANKAKRACAENRS